MLPFPVVELMYLPQIRFTSWSDTGASLMSSNVGLLRSSPTCHQFIHARGSCGGVLSQPIAKDDPLDKVHEGQVSPVTAVPSVLFQSNCTVGMNVERGYCGTGQGPGGVGGGGGGGGVKPGRCPVTTAGPYLLLTSGGTVLFRRQHGLPVTH